MKHKKLYNGIMSLISFAIVGVFTWLLIEFIPTFHNDYKTVYIIAFVLMDLIFFIAGFVSAYKVFTKEDRFAVTKGFNSAIGTILFLSGVLALICGVLALVNYFKDKVENDGLLIPALAILLAGLLIFALGIIIFRRNAKIKDTEARLEKYNKAPEQVQTFNDTKVNKTCKFCGCRLTSENKTCPNCQSKVE